MFGKDFQHDRDHFSLLHFGQCPQRGIWALLHCDVIFIKAVVKSPNRAEQAILP